MNVQVLIKIQIKFMRSPCCMKSRLERLFYNKFLQSPNVRFR